VIRRRKNRPLLKANNPWFTWKNGWKLSTQWCLDWATKLSKSTSLIKLKFYSAQNINSLPMSTKKEKEAIILYQPLWKARILRCPKDSNILRKFWRRCWTKMDRLARKKKLENPNSNNSLNNLWIFENPYYMCFNYIITFFLQVLPI